MTRQQGRVAVTFLEAYHDPKLGADYILCTIILYHILYYCITLLCVVLYYWFSFVLELSHQTTAELVQCDPKVTIVLLCDIYEQN